MYHMNKFIRRKDLFDYNWKFSESDISDSKEPDFDDSLWRNVNLPHDWSIEGEYKKDNPTDSRGGYLPCGICWYRKSFKYDKLWQGKKVFLEFDGIYMNSDVYINGHHLGNRPYGYISFEYELTPYLKEDEENVVAVRVDTSKAPNGRWYTGTGIYRHTWIKIQDPLHIPQWSSFFTTPEISDEEATVSFATEIRNLHKDSRKTNVIVQIFNHADEKVASHKKDILIEPGRTSRLAMTMKIKDPVLWSPENPILYYAKIQIECKGKIVDDELIKFGIRYFEFDSEKGFLLNGKHTLIKGVCNHHDAGPVGAAVPESILEMRLKMLKDMGCNAIRTSHNPFAPEFYQMCDELGILVMDEAFDGWAVTKAPYDYGLYYNEWWRRDLEDFIKRDRNHACIFMWSIGNEVVGQTPEMTREMIDLVHRLDNSRVVTCGVQGRTEMSDKNRSELDVAGYNEGGGACFKYDDDHKKHPDRKFIATEAPHTYQTRSIYRTQTWWRDRFGEREEIENLTEDEIFFDGHLMYNSSYDNAGVRINSMDSWGLVKIKPFLMGEFRWTGFDYIGESFGWPARLGNNGIIDIANFEKDHYYLYQSMFSDKPMVHLLPHWTHPNITEGTIIPVWVYTNCDSVELFLNGKSLGKKHKEDKEYIQWDVAYKPGEIKVIAYNKNEMAASKSYVTADIPADIKLSCYSKDLKPDGRDATQLTFTITDNNGNLVPYADNTVRIHSKGPVINLGMENGDPVDLTPHKVNYRKAFNGLGMGIFQSTFEDGPITIIAGAILGDTLFKEVTKISISVKDISLRGEIKESDYKIYYTLDGSTPDSNSLRYLGPVSICETTTVKAAVFDGNELVLTLIEIFKKGIPEKVIDLLHGNTPVKNLKGFLGPFSDKVVGKWDIGDEVFEFDKDGKVYKVSVGNKRTFRGYWWYDYPIDPFEDLDNAGIGEIKWFSGEINKIELTNQECICMEITFNGTWKRKLNRLA